MARNLKTLGLSLVAAFAMSALVVSAAQAALYFTVSATPAGIVGEAFSETQEWTIAGLTIGCTKVSASATQKVLWDYEMRLEGIKYEECTETETNLPTTITMNGCRYKLTVEFEITKTSAEGTTHIYNCTKPIEINVDNGGCLIKVIEQKVGKITYNDLTGGGGIHYISMPAAITKLWATYKGKLCGNKEDYEPEFNGTFNGKTALGAGATSLTLDP